MENSPFIDGLPIKNGDFPISFLYVYQRVISMILNPHVVGWWDGSNITLW